MSYCTKCGCKLKDGGCPNCNKGTSEEFKINPKKSNNKNIFIGLGVVGGIIVLAGAGFAGTLFMKGKKAEEIKVQGIEYIEKEKYSDAVKSFEQASEITPTDDEIKGLLEATKLYIKIEDNFNEGEVEEVEKLVLELNRLQDAEYFSEGIEDINRGIEENKDVIEAMKGLDGKVESLIKDHKYSEAKTLLESRLKLNLNSEQKSKVEELKIEVSKKEDSYRKELEEKQVASVSRRSEYFAKYDSIERKVANMANEMNNAATVDQVGIAENIYKTWDILLNDIWKELPKHLSKIQMDNLTDVQVDWIKEKEKIHEDNDTTGRHINFILIDKYNSRASMTRERCYELIDWYIK